MKVLRVWISLFVISIFIILAGCGGGKIDYIDDGLNQAPFSKDDIISVKTKTSTVDANGKFQEIVFNHSDSDPSIISCDEGTFQEGVVITVKEIKTTNLGLNPIGSQKYKYLHVITATLGNQAIDEVLILNKPIKLILPTRHLGTDGICYVGVRNSDNDLWTYSRLSDSEIVSLNIHSSRLVEKLPTHYTFYLYKANIQLALFSINQISERDNITADSLTASFTPVIAYKNGTFLNDLNVELTLKGFNLDKLRPSDLETLITYKSRKKNPDTLKANNIACIFKNYGKNNKAVDGNNSLFSHSISISNFDSNFMSGEAKISFTLNLKGVKTQEFSNEFFIELSSISKINNLIPFTYTCCLSFNLKEKSNESSDTNTNTSTNTNSSTDSDTSTNTDTTSNTNTDTNSNTSTNTDTASETNTNTSTNTQTDTYTSTNTNTDSSTGTNTTSSTGSNTSTNTGTDTNSSTNTNSSTDSNTLTNTDTTSNTNTDTNSNTETSSNTNTGSNTETNTTTNINTDTNTNINISVEVYTINYQLNDGRLAILNPDYYDASSATITLNNPTKDYYDFIGWTGSNGIVPQTNVTIPQGSTGDKTYTANYVPISYSIEYDLADGSLGIGISNPAKYDITSATITINNPIREGYTFSGWTGTDLNSASMTINIPQGSVGNRNYTATWTKNSYMLTLNKGTGIAGVTGGGLKEYNSNVIASCTMLPGYEFDSWSGDFNTDNFNMPATNATMTANARAINYNITYNLYNGSVTIPNPTSYNVTSANITLNKPTKSGYEFIGWTNDEIITPQMEVIIPTGSVGTKIYNANYRLIHYTISYNLDNGNVIAANPNSYDITSATITLNNPTKDYYNFIGWTGSNGIVPQTTVTIPHGATENKTYTANYAPISYSITYNLAGGSLDTGISNPTKYDITSATITINNPIREGYTFSGWTGTNLNSATMNLTIPQGSVGDKVFNANWILLLTIDIASDTGSVVEPPSKNLYKFRPSFTITPIVANGISIEYLKTNIFNAINVKDSSNNDLNTVVKNWNENKISLSFSDDLDANATYTIYVNNIDDVIVNSTPLMFNTFYFKGSGTSIDPYLIENLEQLKLLRFTEYWECSFKQVNNINCSNTSITRIGKNDTPFNGNYNGNGKTISNLNDGMFGVIGTTGKIYQLTFNNITKSISGDSFKYGCICNENNGLIQNCTVNNAEILGNDCSNFYVGGICGRNNGNIEYCNLLNSEISFSISSFDSILGSGDGGIGGITGNNNAGRITNCNSESNTIIASTTRSAINRIGGICGSSKEANISACKVTNRLGDNSIIGKNCNGAGFNNNYIGGICGDSLYTNITSCSIDGSNISSYGGNGSYIGGICGRFQGEETFSGCYVDNTNFSAPNGAAIRLGGICGMVNGNLESCFVKNSIFTTSANGCNIGGIGGELSGYKQISSCYLLNSTLEGSGSNNYIGGIVSYNFGKIYSCYVYIDENSEHIISKQGDNGYLGALVAYNYSGSVLSNGFYNRTDLNNLVGNDGTYNYCYSGIADLNSFKTDNNNPRSWSDGLDYNNSDSFNSSNSVWKKYNFTNFPPLLK